MTEYGQWLYGICTVIVVVGLLATIWHEAGRED